ncbi:MAG TPA: sodium:proton antiporter [Gammaproteobacteria bacterium]|nr:sodium:proton antiporter [Gammaproteobacteria bacterium]
MNFEQAMSFVLFTTALCSYVNWKILKLPKSIGVTLVSLLISIFINIISVLNEDINFYAHELIETLGFNEAFLHGMLSFLLFAASIHINTEELSKQKTLVASFATFSVLISTILIAYATYGISMLGGLGLSFYYCLLFGALISPTDAISVIGVLRSMSLPKSLEMKITGEALFNDGMSVGLFFLALALATGSIHNISIEHTFIYFLQVGVGGVLYGAALGWITAKLIDKVDDHELIILLTLVLVTAGHAIAESFLFVSGPIAIVIAGLIVGNSLKRSHVEPATTRLVLDFWAMLDEILNVILFVLIGIEFIYIDITKPVALCSIAIIVIANAARWISVFLPVALLSKLESFNISVITAMTWGGLRGGISIALALGLSGPERDTIVTITYFVVLFSILVQGLSFKPLIAKLFPQPA